MATKPGRLDSIPGQVMPKTGKWCLRSVHSCTRR